jgi:hypothetical protein
MTMKKLIIILAMAALASTAGAQDQREITLPQFLPPSYHSPHGGTGMDFTHHKNPYTPNIPAPQSGGYGGYAREYVVPYERPGDNASPEDRMKALEDHARRVREKSMQYFREQNRIIEQQNRERSK